MDPVLSPHQLSLYNTGRMTPEQVIAAFAARRPLLERILTDLSAEVPQSRPQHHLIVGQRGMGKTMLLARIAAGLRKEDTFTGKFLPLVFAEEQYAVDRLSKFWLNCLDSLADFHEAAKDQAAAEAIDDEVERLTRAALAHAKNDQPFADEAFAAFSAAAARTGRRPVLLVDNLQLVFERLNKEQQHALRELLMRPGCPILIGASPSPPPQSQDYGAAFYDHFKVHYLRPLEEPEMRDLLLHLAAAAGREDVRQRVIQHPARLKVLRQLTGGNPRTTLTLFFLYAEDFAPSVFGDLEGLLDRVTPLYKARLEELTDQQQVIVSAAADHWNPVTAAKLAQITALPSTTISAQLDRLEKTGVVERVEVFPTEERRAEYGTTTQGYQIAERFFNVWFLFRSASRRQRREIEFLTRFLENFYEPSDRTRIAHSLMNEEHISPDRYLLSQALAGSLEDTELKKDLERHTQLLALREQAEEARRKMREVLDFNSLPAATVAFDELRKKLMALVPAYAGVTPEVFSKEVLSDRLMFINGERESLSMRASPLTDSELRMILDSIQKSRRADNISFSKKSTEWFAKRLATGQIRNKNDQEDWIRAIKQAENSECIKLMLNTAPKEITNLEFFRQFGGYDSTDSPLNQSSAADRTEDELQNLAKIQICSSEKYPLLLYIRSNLPSYRQEDAEDICQRVLLRFMSMQMSRKLAPLDGSYFWYLRPMAKFEITNEFRKDRLNKTLLENFANLDSTENCVSDLGTTEDIWHLIDVVNAAKASNWGVAMDSLSRALECRSGEYSFFHNNESWMSASALLIHLGFCEQLVGFLRDKSFASGISLRPWLEALRAHAVESQLYLQNISPEIRPTAEFFYDGIERRLQMLPEKTRRRRLLKPPRQSKKA